MLFDVKLVEDYHLRLPEIPATVGTACGLRSGPPARFEAYQRRQSPNTSHAVSWFPANTVDTATYISGRLRL